MLLWEYIIKVKLKLVEICLFNFDFMFIEIVEELSFMDVSYLFKIFKCYMGMLMWEFK